MGILSGEVEAKEARVVQTGVNEIAAASVVYIRKVRIDYGMGKNEWNTPNALRQFSLVRKLESRPFPPGQSRLQRPFHCANLVQTCR